MARKLAVRLRWMWRKESEYQLAVEFVSHSGSPFTSTV